MTGGQPMSIIKKANPHLLKKVSTSIETAVPNTTYLERRINNRLTIGSDEPARPLLADIWRDTSEANMDASGKPIIMQKQCAGLNPDGSGIWVSFSDYAQTNVDLAQIYARINILEGLVHAMDEVYCTIELDALIAGYGAQHLGYSPVNHTHPEFLSADQQLTLFDSMLFTIEKETYRYATGRVLP
jgi:hypothetical protein